MIRTSQVHHCRACGSTHIVKNGHNRCGSQQYQCRTCGASKVLLPKQRYSEERKAEVLRAYQERSSLRGLSCTFGITRKTITQWLKKLLSLPTVKETLFAAKASDVLELDEAWSFVWRRKNKRWLWTVMCRGTRQIVAFANGDHSEATCRALWERVPEAYRKCRSFSDFWKTYAAVLPDEDSLQCRQGDRADRAHGTLEQQPAPARWTLRPRDPFLLQERLVA